MMTVGNRGIGNLWESAGGSFTVWFSVLVFGANANSDTEIHGANNIDDEPQDDADEDEMETEMDVSGKRFANRIIRSLELVEEYPPEVTYRAPSTKAEPLTTPPLVSDLSYTAGVASPSAPSKPSMPAGVPALPSIPNAPPLPPVSSEDPGLTIPKPPTAVTVTEPKNGCTETATSGVTTISPDVEIIDTTTEDYGSIGEPTCDYDPITFILKCGLNIIISIFGISDTCCKPIF